MHARTHFLHARKQGWDEHIEGLPWRLTLTIGENLFEGGLQCLFAHELGKKIAAVQPTPSVSTTLLSSRAIEPRVRVVDGADSEDKPINNQLKIEVMMIDDKHR